MAVRAKGHHLAGVIAAAQGEVHHVVDFEYRLLPVGHIGGLARALRVLAASLATAQHEIAGGARALGCVRGPGDTFTAGLRFALLDELAAAFVFGGRDEPLLRLAPGPVGQVRRLDFV
jgi:hypothetical protein